MDMNLSKLWELMKDREAVLHSMKSQRVRHDWATEQQEKYSFDPEGITETIPLMATTQINPSTQFYVLDEIKKWHGCSLTTVETLYSAAAAAAKSLQLCPTLCNPINGSPPGSPIPGILLARTLEWVAISFSNAWKWKVKGKSLSRVGLFATPWTAAHQAPPSMGFSRQEYWSWVHRLLHYTELVVYFFTKVSW